MDMMRWLLAVAMILGGFLALAHADYMKIEYNLGASKDGGGPAGPGPGPAGGLGGFKGGGLGGLGGLGGGAGAGGFKGGGGLGGLRGGGLGGLGGGMPGGGAFKGAAGAGGLGGLGGLGGNMGNGPGARGARNLVPIPDDDTPTFVATLVVEYTDLKQKSLIDQNRQAVAMPQITHKWGKTILTKTSDIEITVLPETGEKLPSVVKRLRTRQAELQRDGKTPEKLLELAEWALAHGQIDACASTMTELVQLKPDDPAAIAFKKVQDALKSKLSNKPEAYAFWKEKLGTKYKDSDHYTMLYSPPDNAPTAEPKEVDGYLAKLEANFRSFYYWFALKGKALPMPDHRLLVILINTPEEFQTQKQVFDNPSATASGGFYSRRDNVLVFSAKRTDAAYTALLETTKELWANGWNQEQLLKGGGVGRERSATPQDIAKNQMLALLLKGMQEEAMLATVSSEGSRQLAVVSGVLPRHVAVPEWIQSGLSSFFETPEGAYWPGTGAPHWKHFIRFRSWDENKKLDKPEEALRMVITDGYFRQAGAPPGQEFVARFLRLPGQEASKGAVTKARAMSWALTYFLARQRTDGLMRYFQELNSQPRDMDLSEDTLISCFARAFDMVDPSKPDQLNAVKFNNLAKEWYQDLRYAPLEVQEAVEEGVKKPRGKKPAKPGAPKAEDK
jgi:hypothetical protein